MSITGKKNPLKQYRGYNLKTADSLGDTRADLRGGEGTDI